MVNRNWVPLALIGLLTMFATWVVWPQQPNNYLPNVIQWPERGWIDIKIGDFEFVRKGMTLGLDLQGGVDLVLEADLSAVPQGEKGDKLEGVKVVIERRINAFGVSEPVIQKVGDTRISVQLPGVRNVEEAKNLIGKTAVLDFREQIVDGTGQPVRDANGQPQWRKATATDSRGETRELTGAFFKPNAAVRINPQSGRPEVAFEVIDAGVEIMQKVTRRLIQKPMGIFLDDILISAPTVQSELSSQGVITGLTIQEAQQLAIQLNAGALPVPVTIVKEQNVDATLGSDSVRKSIIAGEIGLVAVALFMIVQYRLPGLIAAVALLNYTVYTLAVFKLMPVTLTMAGIAAFIISVGMAVDANILIFERMREELRAGRTMAAAIEAGFDRAWPSIRDSNMATFISCAILFWFGNQFGASLVTGFAFTLGIGVAISMFSAITVTRQLLRLVIREGARAQVWAFGTD